MSLASPQRAAPLRLLRHSHQKMRNKGRTQTSHKPGDVVLPAQGQPCVLEHVSPPAMSGRISWWTSSGPTSWISTGTPVAVVRGALTCTDVWQYPAVKEAPDHRRDTIDDSVSWHVILKAAFEVHEPCSSSHPRHEVLMMQPPYSKRSSESIWAVSRRGVVCIFLLTSARRQEVVARGLRDADLKSTEEQVWASS